MKNAHHDFPEPKLISSNSFSLLTDRLKSKDILFQRIFREKQQSSHFRSWNQM